MDADKAKALVQESWALVEADLDTHGIKFFMKIFEIAPPALQLFSFKGLYPPLAWLCSHAAVPEREITCCRQTALIQGALPRTPTRWWAPFDALASKTADDADLAKSPKLKEHAAQVMKTVGQAVSSKA